MKRKKGFNTDDAMTSFVVNAQECKIRTKIRIRKNARNVFHIQQSSHISFYVVQYFMGGRRSVFTYLIIVQAGWFS